MLNDDDGTKNYKKNDNKNDNDDSKTAKNATKHETPMDNRHLSETHNDNAMPYKTDEG